MGGLPASESLRVEFKSDRKRLPDADLVAAAVCLANTEGGTIYLGVENDGQPSGLHREHQNLAGLAALIANRTRPSLSVRVEPLDVDGRRVAAIEVPKSHQLVATADGLLQQRRMLAAGTPECAPMYPHEMERRRSDLGLLDYSARVIEEATLADFDPLERERLRQAIMQYAGDRALQALPDADLDAALMLTRRVGHHVVPTLTGLLLLGREEALREHVPTHELAFQVMDGTQVRVNDFYHVPLLRAYELILQQFNTRTDEREIQVGLFRVPVPTYDRAAFREALANAVIHRDYTRLGAVHVRWLPDAIEIGNPGGFVDGVTLQNLLVTEPRPRNPALADAFKRIGLVERTGRGVDIIFQGLLRYGRPAPDYSRSDGSNVIVRMLGGEADLAFLRLVIEQEEHVRAPLPVDTLLALRALQDNPQLDPSALAAMIQKDESTARQVLERMVDAGLAETRGTRRRVYHLSAAVYRQLGQAAAYVRQHGFEPIQQEQMVLQYVQAHGRITRGQAADLCKIGPYQATRLLQRLVHDERLTLRGARRAAYYERGLKL